MSRQWLRLTVEPQTEAPGFDMLVREEDVLDVRSSETQHGPTRVKVREQSEVSSLMAPGWTWITVTQPIAEVHRRLLVARQN